MNDSQIHWQYTIDEEGITWLALNREGETVNTINQGVLLELECLLDNTEILTSKGIVITSAKKKGFIAGADIKQFSSCKNEEDFFDWIRHGQCIFDKLEALAIPTVAMINGFCLGGCYTRWAYIYIYFFHRLFKQFSIFSFIDGS